MAWDLGSITAKLTLDTKSWTTNISSAADAFDKLAQGGEGTLIGLGESIENAGNRISKITDPVLKFGKFSVQSAYDFELAMANVAAISQSTEDELDRLTEAAREMGKATVFSATESADALYYMALAGWDADQSIAALEPVLKLAAAAQVDVARASDIVTDAITAFGLSAEDATHFVDVLAQAAANSNTTVDQLGEAFQYIAPVAGEFGFSVEDTALVLGIFANQGVKAGQAGTTLRTILSRLVAPTEATAEIMQQLGIEIFNTDGSMKDLSEIVYVLRDGFNDLSEEQLAAIYITEDTITALEELGVALYDDAGELRSLIDIADEAEISLEGLTDETRENYLATLSGIRGLTGMSAILNVTDEDLEALIDSLTDTDGALDTMYDTIVDTTYGGWEKFQSALEDLAITIGNILLPVINTLLEWGTNLLNWFNDLPEPVQEIVTWIGAAVAIFGPLLIIIGKIVQAVGLLWPVLQTVGSVFGVLVGILGKVIAVFNPIAAVIAIVVTAFIALYTQVDGFREAVDWLLEKLGEFLSWMWDQFSEFVHWLISFLAELPENIWNAIVTAIDFVADWAAEIFLIIAEWFANIVETVWEWVSQIPGKIWDGIKDAWNKVTEWGSGLWERFKKWVVDTVTTVWTEIKKIPGKIWDGIKGAWNKVKEWGTTLATRGKEAATKTVNKVWTEMKKLPGKITKVGTDVVKGLWNGINDVKDWILGKISGFVDSILGGIKSFFGIRSPSKRMHDEVGLDAGRGVGVGIVDSLPEVLDDVDKFGEGVLDEMEDVFDDLTGNEVALDLVGAFSDVDYQPNFVDSLVESFTDFIDELDTIATRFEGFLTPVTTSNMSYGSTTQDSQSRFNGGSTTNVTIENITVRNDNDLDAISQGLYSQQARVNRARGE